MASHAPTTTLIRLFALSSLAFAVCVASPISGAADELAEEPQLHLVSAARPVPPDSPNLAEMVRQVADKYAAPSQSQVREAQLDVWRAMKRLDARLRRSSRYAAAWREFIRWPELRKQVWAGRNADIDGLYTVLDQLQLPEKGLEKEEFQDLANRLERYIDLLLLVQDPEVKAEYEERVAELAEALEAYDQSGDLKARETIGVDAYWLERFGGQKKLADLIRARYSSPNLFVDASEEFISRGLGRPVDETQPVRDVILGTRITGVGRTIGHVEARLIPDPNRAIIETWLSGVNHSRNTGRNRSAIILSCGTTELTACRRLLLDENGFVALPPSAWANTKTQITGVGSTRRGILGKVVIRAAKKRIPEQKPQSEYIAARHAEDRLRRQYLDETEEALAEANADYQRRFREPLVRRRQFPQLLKFSTTSDSLRITALQAAGERLGAPGEAPPLEGKHLLAVRFHESAINNLMYGLYAGRTLDRQEIEELSLDLLGRLPEGLIDEDEEEREWSITFARRDPVTLTVDNGEAVITLRGERYTSGSRRYDAMNITARYRVDTADNRLRLTRVGPLEIYPPGFKPGEDKLALRQTVLKNRLEKRFANVFKEEILGEGLEFEGEFRKLGVLDMSHLVADDGWVSVAWK